MTSAMGSALYTITSHLTLSGNKKLFDYEFGPIQGIPDSKVYGANMSHVGPMNFAILDTVSAL